VGEADTPHKQEGKGERPGIQREKKKGTDKRRKRDWTLNLLKEKRVRVKWWGARKTSFPYRKGNTTLEVRREPSVSDGREREKRGLSAGKKSSLNRKGGEILTLGVKGRALARRGKEAQFRGGVRSFHREKGTGPRGGDPFAKGASREEGLPSFTLKKGKIVRAAGGGGDSSHFRGRGKKGVWQQRIKNGQKIGQRLRESHMGESRGEIEDQTLPKKEEASHLHKIEKRGFFTFDKGSPRRGGIFRRGRFGSRSLFDILLEKVEKREKNDAEINTEKKRRTGMSAFRKKEKAKKAILFFNEEKKMVVLLARGKKRKRRRQDDKTWREGEATSAS